MYHTHVAVFPGTITLKYSSPLAPSTYNNEDYSRKFRKE